MNYLIEGVSGSGKTTVCAELKKRGFKSVDADEDLAYYGDPTTGQPTNEKSPMNWLWDKDRTNKLLNNNQSQTIFVCGGAMNQNDFAHYFKKTFVLIIDNETLTQRLATRTNNDFGKHPEELALQLEWNEAAARNAKSKGAVLIDGTKSVELVVDEILKYVL